MTSISYPVYHVYTPIGTDTTWVRVPDKGWRQDKAFLRRRGKAPSAWSTSAVYRFRVLLLRARERNRQGLYYRIVKPSMVGGA